jgi:hypothetical protein
MESMRQIALLHDKVALLTNKVALLVLSPLAGGQQVRVLQERTITAGTGRESQEGGDGLLSPTTFPKTLRGLRMPESFVSFYLNGWYVAFQAGSSFQVNKSVKKTLRSVIEFVSLFLTTPVPLLPSDAVNGISPQAAPWRRVVRSAADNAWKRAKEFVKSHLRFEVVSHALSTFEKNMKSIDPGVWPNGPDGNDPFGVLRTTAEIKEATTKNKKKRPAEQITDG